MKKKIVCEFWQVQDKFRLDLTDEEAVHYMQSLIDVSVSATMAALMEQMHKWAQVSIQVHYYRPYKLLYHESEYLPCDCRVQGKMPTGW